MRSATVFKGLCWYPFKETEGNYTEVQSYYLTLESEWYQYPELAEPMKPGTEKVRASDFSVTYTTFIKINKM
jgi:hypothetical protein